MELVASYLDRAEPVALTTTVIQQVHAELMGAIYPFAGTPWMMGACATLLGLTLGSVQPMIMTTLHQLTPNDRHGEAIALRSMTINFSSALMPLLFGALGALVGASALFWLMGAVVGAGSWPARRVAAVSPRQA